MTESSYYNLIIVIFNLMHYTSNIRRCNFFTTFQLLLKTSYTKPLKKSSKIPQ